MGLARMIRTARDPDPLQLWGRSIEHAPCNTPVMRNHSQTNVPPLQGEGAATLSRRRRRGFTRKEAETVFRMQNGQNQDPAGRFKGRQVPRM